MGSDLSDDWGGFEDEHPKVKGALEIEKQMREWQRRNGSKWPD